ncbi:MAG: hypothetical protein IKN71_00795 [Alphaproteobacteria bacterium]|nr:hypothetical protein [Alphaproteobacteria bacterium]
MNISALKNFLVAHNLNTPVMFYDENEAEKAVALISEYLKNSDIYFAVKSCYNLNLLRYFARRGLGAEVMSELELDLAQRAKFKKIILNGLGRSEACLMKALKQKNTTLIVDTLRDLGIVKNYLAAHPKASCQLGIRLRFDAGGLQVATPYSNQKNKLGNYVDSEVYKEFIALIQNEKRAKWDIVHMHFTINELCSEPYIAAMKILREHLADIKQKYAIMPQRIDLGGGIEVYSANREDKLKKLFTAVADEFAKLFSPQKLVLEPGRFLSASAGYVLGKVIDIKQIKNKKWLITDIGTNVLIPNQNARYELLHPLPSDGGENIGITDGITSGANNIVENTHISQPVQIGDDIIIGGAGAYTDVYSTFWGYAPFVVCHIYKSGKIKITRSPEDVNLLHSVFFPKN